MQGFSSEVADRLGYYVYRLIDPRNAETFYVGKGFGNRVFQHAAGASVSDGNGVESDKIARIHAIQLAGFEVGHVIHRHGLDNDTAFQVEAALMEAYPGLTNIMGGHGSDEFGVMHASEIQRLYEARLADFNHKVLLVDVKRLAAEQSLYEATRFAWGVNVSRAEAVDFVLPVVAGIIRGVFIAERWLSATEANFPGREAMPGRWGFEGREAPPEIIELYRYKRVIKKRGDQSSFRYVEPSKPAS